MKNFVVIPISMRKQEDEKIINWLKKLPNRKRSCIIRSILKRHIKGVTIKSLTITGSSLLLGVVPADASPLIDMKPINDFSWAIFQIIVYITLGACLPILGYVGLRLFLGSLSPSHRGKAKEMFMVIIGGLIFLAASPWIKDGLVKLMRLFPGFPG